MVIKFKYIPFFLLTAYFLNHLLAFEVGFFFFTPYEFSLLALAFGLVIRPVIPNHKIMLVSFAFVAWLALAPIIAFMQGQINFTTVILKCGVLLGVLGAHSLLSRLSIEEIQSLFNALFKVVIGIVVLELFVIIVEFFVGAPLLRIGLIDVHDQDFRFFGFHNERLFISEFLALGYVVLKNKYRLLANLVWFLAIVFTFINQSYTGIVLLIAIFFLTNRFGYRQIILLSVVSTGFILLFPIILSSVFSEGESVYFLDKFFRYFVLGGTETFRYLSNAELLRSIWYEPSVFGHGYESGSGFVANRLMLDDPEPSHSIISIAYDNGLVGIILFITYFVALMSQFFKNRGLLSDPKYQLALTFWIISVLRFLVYYHSTFHIYYFLAPTLLWLAIKSNKSENPSFQS